LKIRKLTLRILFWILTVIFVIVLFIAAFALLSFIQGKLFLPQDYILWTFNYPVSRLVFIFELYFIFVFFRNSVSAFINFAKRNKKWFYPVFAFANLLLVYAVLFNVSVITKNVIINHTFFLPQGQVYNYSDIVSIDTGVYTKKRYLPYTHSNGEFYYIITLKDGTTINLNDSIGGTQNNQDVYEVFEEIDKTLVNMGIKKISKIETFQDFDKHIDKIYADRIRNVLENVK